MGTESHTEQDRYRTLRLKNQLCFPLYAAAKEVTRLYRSFLDPLGLTYTQYIAMMVMWEHKQLNVTDIGEYLYLDSGTMTGVLKKLEEKELVTRTAAKEDKRIHIITLTTAGEELQEAALAVPQQMSCLVRLGEEEAGALYDQLYRLLDILRASAAEEQRTETTDDYATQS